MKTTTQDLTFWDHLEEFRWTLVRSAIALLIFTIFGFIVMPYIYDPLIMGPTSADFFLYRALVGITSRIGWLPDFAGGDFRIQIINIQLASQFFRHITTSFYLAVILTFPYLVFEVWRFIRPALYSNEKKNIRTVFCFGTVMFFAGCVVGYILVFPVTFHFLATYQISGSIQNQISLDSYMDNFLMMIFMMGVVFELPLLAWILSRTGLINRKFFITYRRHAIIALLVLAAFITPSGDPFTLAVVFFPLYFLFELSRFMVRPEEEKV
ncbi:MAG: twin-arginine translocase subunit TatC [Bacteroides sp.]|nr:twin-arginine translocase subunit TatC [Bacteroides sp.]